MKIIVINSIDEGEGSIKHLIGKSFETSKTYEPLENGTIYIETVEGVYPIKPEEYKKV